MKTTSSKLKTGVMILAALFIPATTWWVSLRYYNASRQTAENEVTLKRLTEIKQKYEGMVQENEKLKEIITDKQKVRDWLRSRTAPDSVEFAPKPMRTTWNGQTDPDRVWHEQRQRASELLIRLDAPVVDAPRRFPANPSLPRRLPAR